MHTTLTTAAGATPAEAEMVVATPTTESKTYRDQLKADYARGLAAAEELRAMRDSDPAVMKRRAQRRTGRALAIAMRDSRKNR